MLIICDQGKYQNMQSHVQTLQKTQASQKQQQRSHHSSNEAHKSQNNSNFIGKQKTSTSLTKAPPV